MKGRVEGQGGSQCVRDNSCGTALIQFRLGRACVGVSDVKVCVCMFCSLTALSALQLACLAGEKI